MKHLLATALLALLCAAGLSACGGDDAVLTVNGDVVLTQDDWEDELDDLADAPDALTALDGHGDGAETVSAGFVSSVLGNHVLLPLIEGEVADRGLEITQEDIDNGTQILTDTLAAGGSAGIPLDLEDVPGAYHDVLVDLYSAFTALLVDEGGDPTDPSAPGNQDAQQAISERLNQLRADADVEVAERYGSWNADPNQLGVDPPAGPVDPQG